MKNNISQGLKVSRILSLIVLVLGIVLVTYMIKVEDEPGALPLFLILSGGIWFLITRYRIKKAVTIPDPLKSPETNLS